MVPSLSKRLKSEPVGASRCGPYFIRSVKVEALRPMPTAAISETVCTASAAWHARITKGSDDHAMLRAAVEQTQHSRIMRPPHWFMTPSHCGKPAGMTGSAFSFLNSVLGGCSPMRQKKRSLLSRSASEKEDQHRHCVDSTRIINGEPGGHSVMGLSVSASFLMPSQCSRARSVRIGVMPT